MGGLINSRALSVALTLALLLPGSASALDVVVPAVPDVAVPAVPQASAAVADAVAAADPGQPPVVVPAPAAAAAPPTAAPAPAPAPARADVAPAPAPNVNVDVRIGSAGDNGAVTQTSPGSNVNVDVRIDSPGQNGGVTQTGGGAPPPARSRPPAPQAAAPPSSDPGGPSPTIVWHWVWTSACGANPAASALRTAVELDWRWSCDQPALAVPGADELPVTLPVVPAVGVSVPIRAALPSPPSARRHGRPRRAHGLRPAVSRGPLAARGAEAATPAWRAFAARPAGTLARAPTGRSGPRRAAHRAHTRRPGPAPVSPEIPLLPVSLVVASAASGPSTALTFLLALALLGAVALSGPAGPVLRLASVTRRLPRHEGRRLERPG